MLTKDEQPVDENQSSLEDYFTQSEDIEDSPSDIDTNASNKDNPSATKDDSTQTDNVTNDEEEPPLDVPVEDSETPTNLPPSFLLPSSSRSSFPYTIMNLINSATLVLLASNFASALQLPSSEVSRRSAIATIATTSSAALASGSMPNIALAKESVGGPSVLLNSENKKQFPLASFGLQIYNDDTAYKLTLTALEAGYRNFFASVLAGNQKGFAR